MTNAPDYVPAAGRAAFTAFYDTAMATTMREKAWRPNLTEAVVNGLPDNGVVADIGCGTATQAIMIAQVRPDADIIGIDGDPSILAIAAAKPGAEHLQLRSGLTDDLPLPDGHADRAIMTLVLHHLKPDAKVAALREARRILKPAGVLHVVDWSTPTGLLPRLGFTALSLLDGRSNTRDHRTGQWLNAFTAAGLQTPHTLRRLSTAWGTLEHVATSPAALDHP